MRRQYAASEDDLVGAGRLIDRFESNGAVERSSVGRHRPQSDPPVAMTGMLDEPLHEGTTHPDSSHIWRDIHVSNSGNIRIVEVGISIQSPDCSET
jgi:hypothetical protein